MGLPLLRRTDMTNPIAIALGLLITGLIVLDIIMTGGHNLFFVARKFVELIEWLAIWR